MDTKSNYPDPSEDKSPSPSADSIPSPSEFLPDKNTAEEQAHKDHDEEQDNNGSIDWSKPDWVKP